MKRALVPFWYAALVLVFLGLVTLAIMLHLRERWRHEVPLEQIRHHPLSALPDGPCYPPEPPLPPRPRGSKRKRPLRWRGLSYSFFIC